MKIAQVAPLYESVPPRLYGGTERIVSYLTEELVRQGHDVTLYASGDSRTAARLAPAWPRALRLDPGHVDRLAPHLVMLEQVARDAEDFDLIHYHVDYLHFPFSRRSRVPQLTTLHGRLDLPELPALYGEYRDMPLVSVSDHQRAPLPGTAWAGTVYHGLPEELHRLQPRSGGYLAFVGRISPEKRVDRAVEIAARTGLPLKVAGKVDPADAAYFQTVAPLFEQPFVEYRGEIAEQEKHELMAGALALLFPIDWPEPFGMVMIEAMACGTPVIAWGKGSVPEVVDEGESGFIVSDLEQAVAAVGRVGGLDRRRVRAVFEQRFSVRRMVADYLRVYDRVMGQSDGSNGAGAGGGKMATHGRPPSFRG